MNESENVRAVSDLGENPTLRAVLDAKIGWIEQDDGMAWAPFSPHREHQYDGACAVCRAGNEPRALNALLAFLAARELVVPSPQPADECATCGHERRKHIYYEGACRPGFTCPKGCTHFVAVSPLTYAPKEK